jgi:hypothetical protein
MNIVKLFKSMNFVEDKHHSMFKVLKQKILWGAPKLHNQLNEPYVHSIPERLILSTLWLPIATLPVAPKDPIMASYWTLWTKGIRDTE